MGGVRVGLRLRAGGKETMSVADRFWGGRYGTFTDPFGHTWDIATRKEELTEEEVSSARKTSLPPWPIGKARNFSKPCARSATALPKVIAGALWGYFFVLLSQLLCRTRMPTAECR